MTLAKGDHLVKLDPTTGQPVQRSAEVFIEWQIVEVSAPISGALGLVTQFVFIRKVY